VPDAVELNPKAGGAGAGACRMSYVTIGIVFAARNFSSLSFWSLASMKPFLREFRNPTSIVPAASSSFVRPADFGAGGAPIGTPAGAREGVGAALGTGATALGAALGGWDSLVAGGKEIIGAVVLVTVGTAGAGAVVCLTRSC